MEHKNSQIKKIRMVCRSNFRRIKI